MDLELMKAKIEANSSYNDGWTRQFYQEIVDKYDKETTPILRIMP